MLVRPFSSYVTTLSSLGILAFAALIAPACGSNGSTEATANVDDAGTTDTGTADTGTSDAGGDAACTFAPKSGAFTLAAAADPAETHMGEMTSLVVDAHGDPVIAFTSQGKTGKLYLTRWDRCVGAFTKPMVVDQTGGADAVQDPVSVRQVSLARDPATGALAIAYAKVVPHGTTSTQSIWLAKSTDDGATWKKEQLSVHPDDAAGDIHKAVAPSAVFGGGKIWVAYGQGYSYCDGSFTGTAASARCEGFLVSGDLGAWSREAIPRGSNGRMDASTSSIAADATGNVALAYVTQPDTGYDRVVTYWRHGASPVAVFDSSGEQNDDAAVSLAFFGTKPRIASLLRQAATVDYTALFSQSDDGVTWAPAVHVPRNGTRIDTWYLSLALDAKGALAIAANDNGGGSASCGAPTLARSTDGSTWTACGADPVPESGTSGAYVSAAYGADGKLQLAFGNQATGGKYGVGVLYWHE